MLTMAGGSGVIRPGQAFCNLRGILTFEDVEEEVKKS
jgi:hypothetical protein